ncbi:alpha/beta hydrolase fold domain-containing protein [Salipiger abyssi]|uniref:alpha/beta hydrolase fold domain-containing protein n=1 Tax=Salipiger abyssi TaxID=1250539 RepID=UPI001A8FC172|nr:alpha/beta hydrolase [Salipiger abyssi]MBN9886973.1 alpha/beta hydrolase [Salipiger abyssi]
MSRRLAALNLLLRVAVKPRLARTRGPEEAAREFARTAALILRRPSYLLHLERPGGLHWISAGPCVPRRVILYFHGGGYITGSPYTHEGVMARLSKLARAEVCAPAYPLAQDAPFPAAFDAAVAAWSRCRALGYRPEQIALAGDSAGGGLALALLAWCCGQGERPAAALVFSPWTDLAMTGESLTGNARADPFLPVARIGELVDLVRGALPRDDPRLSPLHADFPGCPPVMIHHSETEILADDARRMAARLRAQGASVALCPHPDAPHAWPVFDGWIPEARQTLRQGARFLQDSFAATSR